MIDVHMFASMVTNAIGHNIRGMTVFVGLLNVVRTAQSDNKNLTQNHGSSSVDVRTSPVICNANMSVSHAMHLYARSMQWHVTSMDV